MQPFLERDLLELTPTELDCFLAGVVHGYLEGAHNGYHQGRHDADQEAAVLQRRAAKIVHALARIDPHPGHGRPVSVPPAPTSGPRPEPGGSPPVAFALSVELLVELLNGCGCRGPRLVTSAAIRALREPAKAWSPVWSKAFAAGSPAGIGTHHPCLTSLRNLSESGPRRRARAGMTSASLCTSVATVCW